MAVGDAEGVFAAAFGDVAGEEGDVFCGRRRCELQVQMGRLGGCRACLPRTVRSAGLEEMMAAAKAMVRSVGSLRCACAMLALWDGRRWVRCKSGCEDC